MGWFSNMVFGKTANQAEAPKPKEHDVWGVDKEEIPSMAEQKVAIPDHDPTPPVVNCVRVEPHLSSDGKQLDLWICLTNTFNGGIEVTRVECLRQTTKPIRFLKPGENHELQVYRGPILADDSENKAYITYKSMNSGDYYRAEYLIKYKYSQHEGGEQYVPYELDLVKPVRTM